MPWIKKHNVFFIHIPKTGGSTILKMFGLDVALEQTLFSDIFFHFDEKYEYIHSSAKMLKKMAPDVYSSCFKFTIVRNPYDRLVSEYFWRKKYFRTHAFDSSDMSFDQFLIHVHDNMNLLMKMPHLEISHFLSQKSFVDKNVKVFKYEMFDDCVDFLVKKYNLNKPVIRENQTEHEHYEFYYTPKLKKLVQEMYLADFHEFGYKK